MKLVMIGILLLSGFICGCVYMVIAFHAEVEKIERLKESAVEVAENAMAILEELEDKGASE